MLFHHPCKNPATTRCSTCQKPICVRHTKEDQARPFCVTCLREQLKDRRGRGSRAHLRDDPYFYWYFHDSGWDNDDEPYSSSDYGLFDGGPSAGALGDGDFDGGWEGS